MSPTAFVFLNYVCPSLGIVMASGMFAAPIHSLREAIAHGSLGNLNPTPWAFMTGNCLGWVAYAFITRDFFVLFANAPGLLLSVWLNIGAVKLQYLEQRRSNENLSFLALTEREALSCSGISYDIHSDEVDSTELIGESRKELSNSTENCLKQGISINNDENELDNLTPALSLHERWIITILFLWVSVLSVVGMTPMTSELRAKIVGIAVNINLVVFYGAPLSTIMQVISTRNSASIHLRTLGMALFNSFFWMSYGFAVHDLVISIPNACGFVLAMVQVFLCISFSREGYEISESLIGDQLQNDTIDHSSNIV